MALKVWLAESGIGPNPELMPDQEVAKHVVGFDMPSVTSTSVHDHPQAPGSRDASATSGSCEMDLFHIHSYNTTSLFQHRELLQEPGAHLRCPQETSLTGTQRGQVVQFLQAQGFRFNLTNLDPEQVRPTGGLGVLACAPYRVHALAP